jgi:PKD repeat protein
VSFSAAGSTDSYGLGAIATYVWSFGDGTTGTGVNTTHLFSAVGTFNVTVLVTDATGMGVNSSAVTVKSEQPQAVPPTAVTIAASTTSGIAPLLVQLSAVGILDSVDADVTYEWTMTRFIGGGVAVTEMRTGKSIYHVFTDVGTFTVSLVVTWNYAVTLSSSITVVTSGTPPVAVASATSATLGAAPLTVSFSAADSIDSDGPTALATYLWSFGDGSPTATGVTTSHMFNIVGTFNVTVLVTDNSGLSDTSAPISVRVTKGPFPSGISLAEHGASGQHAVELLGARLVDVAGWYSKNSSVFADLLRHDATLRLDTSGHVFVVDSTATQRAEAATVGQDRLAQFTTPEANTFNLHSHPGSSRTIYLDFNGATLSGTAWNRASSLSRIVAVEFNLDGVTGFNSEELLKVLWLCLAASQ